MQKLREKVKFLVEDAPALAMTVNPKAPITTTDLVKEYHESLNGKAENLQPLASAGKNLTRTPIVAISFGADKGKLILPQLITAKRLGKGYGDKGLYGIRYDPAATQFVLNMLKNSIIGSRVSQASR